MQFALHGKAYSLPCRFRGKYTPDGLVEALDAQVPKKTVGVLYTGHLDAAMVFAMLTRDAAEAFNREVAQAGDTFRWRRVS